MEYTVTAIARIYHESSIQFALRRALERMSGPWADIALRSKFRTLRTSKAEKNVFVRREQKKNFINVQFNFFVRQ